MLQVNDQIILKSLNRKGFFCTSNITVYYVSTISPYNYIVSIDNPVSNKTFKIQAQEIYKILRNGIKIYDHNVNDIHILGDS